MSTLMDGLSPIPDLEELLVECGMPEERGQKKQHQYGCGIERYPHIYSIWNMSSYYGESVTHTFIASGIWAATMVNWNFASRKNKHLSIWANFLSFAYPDYNTATTASLSLLHKTVAPTHCRPHTTICSTHYSILHTVLWNMPFCATTSFDILMPWR